LSASTWRGSRRALPGSGTWQRYVSSPCPAKIGRLSDYLDVLLDLRQHSRAGLNKGETSNSVRRAVFFHRQGEIRGRTTAEPGAVVNVNCLNDRARFTSVPAGYDFEGETSENRSSRHAANWMSAIIRR
jgi:hypothetical protein